MYDAYPGGIGFSAPLFGMHAELLTRTRDLVAACPCDNGCPSCVGPVGETGPLAKTVALRLLDHLLRGQFRDVSVPAAVAAGSDDVPF
jgi:DEAD/DEAH box helicase domain-containing protein